MANMGNFMLSIFYHQKKGVTDTLGMENEGMETYTSFPENKGCVCVGLLYIDDK